MLQKLKVPKRFYSVRALMAALLLVGLVGGGAVVHADQYSHQIQVLSNDNAARSNKVDDLQLQANSYQDAISKLNQQIDAIQVALGASTAQQAKLQQEIEADKQQITVKKTSLSDDIKTMYVDGQMSTIEELATSKSLSDYVDKEEYRTSVQNQLESDIQTINALEARLKSQKAQIDQLVATQQQQQSKLDSDQQQKTDLLSYNQNQQNQYNSQIQSNKKKLSALEAEQAAVNAASSRTISGGYVGPSGGFGGNCANPTNNANGGYPMAWCNADQDSVTASGGFPNRECTSFAYWYFTSVEGKSISVYGNAKDWVDTSSRPVTQTPHIGDIFVNTAGDFGHVGIVVGISGGWVQTISMNDDYYGHFYNTREYPIGNLYYIH